MTNKEKKEKQTQTQLVPSRNVKQARESHALHGMLYESPGRRTANRLGQGDQSAAAVITPN